MTIRNPFIPMRVTGRDGLATVEEVSRIEDLIKGSWGTFIEQVNTALTEIDQNIVNITFPSAVATQPRPMGMFGFDDSGDSGGGGIGDVFVIPPFHGTAGSVIFLGPGGTFTQDNPNFFWDDTNNRLGIGTTTPRAGIEINGSIIEKGPRADVRAFGAIGDGVTDDTTAVQNALNASTNVYFPAGTYIVSNVTTATDGTRIFGDGNLSIVSMKAGATGSMIDCGAHRITAENLTLFGGITSSMKATSAFGDRNGISFNSNVNSRLDGLTVHGFSFVGINYVPVGGDRISHAIVTNCAVYNNWMGLSIQPNGAEYIRVVSLDVNNNYYGIATKAGNVDHYGCKVNDNGFGAYVFGTGNVNNGHGNFSQCLINHNTTNIYVEDVSIGYIFANNNVFEGPIQLVNSTGIVISDSILDVTDYYFDGGGRNYIRDNYVHNGNANTVHHNFNGHTDATLMIDNYTPTGTFIDNNRKLYAAAIPGVGEVILGQGSNQVTTDSDFRFISDILTLSSAGAGNIAIALTRAGGQGIEKQGTGDLFIGTLGAAAVGLYTSNVTQLLIDSSGKIFLGAGATSWFDETPSGTTAYLNIGDASTTIGNSIATFTRNANAGTFVTVINPNAGTTANAGFAISQSLSAYTNYLLFDLQSSGWTTTDQVTANSALLQLVNSTGAPIVYSNYSTGSHIFTTGATGFNGTVRMTIGSTGVSVANLSAGGVVYSTASTAVLKIGTSTEVAAAITWPATGDILFSNGTAAAPVGDAGFTYDDSADIVTISSGDAFALYNLGVISTDTNYERLRLFRGSNIYNLKSEKAGTGVVRAITIDADTATLTLAGTNVVADGTGVTIDASDTAAVKGVNAVQLYTALGTSPDVLIVPGQITPRLNATVASATGAVFDGLSIDGDLTLSGSTPTTTVNFTAFQQPTIVTAATVTNSANVYISDAPFVSSGGGTITNKYSIWVDAGLSRFDGNGTHVFELPADATGNATAATGRVPINIGGATKYFRYYND